MKKLSTLFLFLGILNHHLVIAQTTDLKKGDYLAHKASKPVLVDGNGNDKDWAKASSQLLDNTWLGLDPSQDDVTGTYKILWDENYVYYLVTIHDDSLSDQHKSPFELWWEDDCLELFIDENNSDGNHQYNHSAFAYHITLDLDVVDMSSDEKPLLLNDHILAKWIKTAPHTYTWEVALRVFDDTFDEKSKKNMPIKLAQGKKMGFAVSYNDNDGNFKRENFIGSVPISGEDKNRAWIDAGIFGTLELAK